MFILGGGELLFEYLAVTGALGYQRRDEFLVSAGLHRSQHLPRRHRTWTHRSSPPTTDIAILDRAIAGCHWHGHLRVVLLQQMCPVGRSDTHQQFGVFCAFSGCLPMTPSIIILTIGILLEPPASSTSIWSRAIWCWVFGVQEDLLQELPALRQQVASAILKIGGSHIHLMVSQVRDHRDARRAGQVDAWPSRSCTAGSLHSWDPARHRHRDPA